MEFLKILSIFLTVFIIFRVFFNHFSLFKMLEIKKFFKYFFQILKKSINSHIKKSGVHHSFILCIDIYFLYYLCRFHPSIWERLNSKRCTNDPNEIGRAHV